MFSTWRDSRQASGLRHKTHKKGPDKYHWHEKKVHGFAQQNKEEKQTFVCFVNICDMSVQDPLLTAISSSTERKEEYISILVIEYKWSQHSLSA